MSGLLGKKIGMTHIYDEAGKIVPVTVIEAGPCVVTQVRTMEKDGYSAIQLGYDEKKVKNTPKAEQGHFAKAGTTPKKLVREFTRFENPEDSKLSKRSDGGDDGGEIIGSRINGGNQPLDPSGDQPPFGYNSDGPAPF